MIPPIPILEDYGMSPEHGFLPIELPLEVLPDPYYRRWEAVVGNLQALILSRRLRGVVDGMPVLSTWRLQRRAELRRAYNLLAFMTHAYIWGGDKPAEVFQCTDMLCIMAFADGHPESSTFHLDTFSTSLQIPRTTPSSYVRRRLSLELQANISR